jgi:2-alkyl-3-oxoalkanoate reductase
MTAVLVPARADGDDPNALKQLLEGVDAVANCVTGDGAYVLSNARRLFTCVASASDKPRIVHLSSMTVYGSATGWVSENSELLANLGPYSQAHCAAERLAKHYERSVVLRPGVEYGPNCIPWCARVAQWLQARRLGDLGALGDGYCNLVYIDDLVAAVLQALRQPDIEGQSINVAAPNPPTWNEYFIAFACALRAVPVRRVTRRWLDVESCVFAPPLKLMEKLAQRARVQASWLPPAIPRSLLTLCRQDIRMRLDLAQRHLKPRWTSLDVGVESAAAWCRDPLSVRRDTAH